MHHKKQAESCYRNSDKGLEYVAAVLQLNERRLISVTKERIRIFGDVSPVLENASSEDRWLSLARVL